MSVMFVFVIVNCSVSVVLATYFVMLIYYVFCLLSLTQFIYTRTTRSLFNAGAIIGLMVSKRLVRKLG